MSDSSRRALLPYQIVFGVTSAAIGGIIAMLGELRDELGFTDTGIGLIVAVGFLASFVAQITLAPLADRGFGRQMAVSGVMLGAAALVVMVFADTITLWVAARAALGFGGGLLLPGIRRAATVIDPARAGENLGRLIVGEVIGFTIGPVVAAVLVEIGGIRLPFIVTAIGMLIFVPVTARLPDDQGRRTGRVEHSFDLLRLRRLQGALTLVFGYFILLGAFEVVIPLLFQDRGGGVLETGLAFTIFGVPIALVSTHAGRTADRLGGAKVAMIGMTVAAGVTASYGFIPGIWPLIAVMTVAAVADGYGFTAGQVAVSRAVPEERQAGALGLMGAAEVLGAGLAAIPSAVLYETSGVRTTWLVIAGASLACLGIGALRIRGTDPIISTPPPTERHPPAPTMLHAGDPGTREHPAAPG